MKLHRAILLLARLHLKNLGVKVSQVRKGRFEVNDNAKVAENLLEAAQRHPRVIGSVTDGLIDGGNGIFYALWLRDPDEEEEDIGDVQINIQIYTENKRSWVKISRH
jgi:hypothetical protein